MNPLGCYVKADINSSLNDIQLLLAIFVNVLVLSMMITKTLCAVETKYIIRTVDYDKCDIIKM